MKQLKKGTVVTVSGWRGEDFNLLCRLIKDDLESRGYSFGVVNYSQQSEQDAYPMAFDRVLMVPEHSLQGIVMIDAAEGNYILALPAFCSPEDIMLFFSVVRAIRKVNGACRILWRDSNCEVYPTDERLAEVEARNLESTYAELDYPGHKKIVLLLSPIRNYYAMPLPEGSEIEKMRYTVKVLDDMEASTWMYINIKEAPRLYSDSDADNIISFLDNKSDRIVGDCSNIGLINSLRITKMVSRKTFVGRMKGHPCFEMIDAKRFVIHKMEKSEWDELCKSFRVSAIPTPPKSLLN